MPSGLHHITLIARKVQANVDFYMGFLGLRLVKRTAGFEDATQLHLFYGDAEATPGSIVTFLIWEDGAPGRVGHGAPGEIAFAIRAEAIGFWLTRALSFGVRATGPAVEFGDPVLRLTDPDGVMVKLVGTPAIEDAKPWMTRDIASENTIQRLQGATIFSERPDDTANFLTRHMGFAERIRNDAIIRLGSDTGSVIDVRNASGFWTAAPGTGTIDHVAVRAPNRAHVETTATALASEGHARNSAHHRKYFYSLYVREPQGSLIELATDTPGFTIDEPLEALGATLFIPPHFMKDEADIRVMLPQFGLPGEPRIVYRDLPFVHRIHEPERSDGSTVIALHGTGGNEASLLPLARRQFPHATLIGIRGRSIEEGVARFFRRFDAVTFDQRDIASEAQAFEAFVARAIEAYRLSRTELTFLGYSNGANMLGAAMLLYPSLIRRAVLVRPMMVLEGVEKVELPETKVLMLSGEKDPYMSYAALLETALSSAGADVVHEIVDAGHAVSANDESIIGAWQRGLMRPIAPRR